MIIKRRCNHYCGNHGKSVIVESDNIKLFVNRDRLSYRYADVRKEIQLKCEFCKSNVQLIITCD